MYLFKSIQQCIRNNIHNIKSRVNNFHVKFSVSKLRCDSFNSVALRCGVPGSLDFGKQPVKESINTAKDTWKSSEYRIYLPTTTTATNKIITRVRELTRS